MYHGPTPWRVSFPAAVVLQQNSTPQPSLPLVNPAAPPGVHQTSPNSPALPSSPVGPVRLCIYLCSRAAAATPVVSTIVHIHRTQARPHSALILPEEPPFQTATFIFHLAPPTTCQS